MTTLEQIVAVAKERGIHPETGLQPYGRPYNGEDFPWHSTKAIVEKVVIARHWFSERTPVHSMQSPRLVDDLQSELRRDYNVVIPHGWIQVAAVLEGFSLARTYPSTSCIGVGRRRPVPPELGSFRRWVRGWALLTNDNIGRVLRDIREDDDMPEIGSRGELLRYVRTKEYNTNAVAISEAWNRYRRFRGALP